MEVRHVFASCPQQILLSRITFEAGAVPPPVPALILCLDLMAFKLAWGGIQQQPGRSLPGVFLEASNRCFRSPRHVRVSIKLPAHAKQRAHQLAVKTQIPRRCFRLLLDSVRKLIEALPHLSQHH